ncbi:hypothetical protein ABZY58_11070 [Micromonospora tulbaghiae]|uniref:hypothetical protein n=1 Tax=Micromonospora tulbaghiae TaxID=479978 RepID=UPI0033B3A67F
MNLTEKQRLDLAVQQVYLMTGGRTDRTGCYVLISEGWRSQDDMCPEKSTHQVCVDDYRCGMSTGGQFFPAETTTTVCAGHEEQVRRAAGFRWSRPIGG